MADNAATNQHETLPGIQTFLSQDDQSIIQDPMLISPTIKVFELTGMFPKMSSSLVQKLSIDEALGGR